MFEACVAAGAPNGEEEGDAGFAEGCAAGALAAGIAKLNFGCSIVELGCSTGFETGADAPVEGTPNKFLGASDAVGALGKANTGFEVGAAAALLAGA